MTNKYAGRSTYRFRQLRAEFLRRCKAANSPCWLCGKPMDFSLHHKHPEAFNVDHAIPVSIRPDLAEDIGNFRPAHAHCNARRRDDEPFLDLGIPSEVW